jgi:hypothetical protein
MSRHENTNEYRIQKIGLKGSPAIYVAQRKILVWDNWNPFSKKPSGYFWATVVDNRGKGGIGGGCFELIKDDLDKYIRDQEFYKECNETVYETGKAQEKC